MLVLRDKDVNPILKGLTALVVSQRHLITQHSSCRLQILSILKSKSLRWRVIAMDCPVYSISLALMEAFWGFLNSGEITGYRTALASIIMFTNRQWQGPGSIVVSGGRKQAEWHARLALICSKQKIDKLMAINRGQSTLMFSIAMCSQTYTGNIPTYVLTCCQRLGLR